MGILGPSLLSETLGALHSDIVDIDFFDGRPDNQGSLQLGAALGTCTADGEDGGVLPGEQLHGHTTGGPGTFGTDLSTVGDTDWQLGIRVVENHRNAGPGQTFLIVHGPTTDPFDPRHSILSANIARHGVNTAIDILVFLGGSPPHDTLTRDQNISLLCEKIGPLYIVDDRLHVSAAQLLHVPVVQKQDIRLAHIPSSFLVPGLGNFFSVVSRRSRNSGPPVFWSFLPNPNFWRNAPLFGSPDRRWY